MNYEILFLISPKIEEKDVPTIVEKIEKIIQDLKGKISYRKDLGEKKLAYPIKHERKAYFVVIYFNFSPEELKKLEEKLKNIQEILRYQITKIKSLKEISESNTKTEEKDEKVLKNI